MRKMCSNKFLPCQCGAIPLVLIFALGGLSCRKAQYPHVSAAPLVEGAVLQFRGYVTDTKGNLVSQEHKFSRRVIGLDSNGKNGHTFAYVSQNETTPFFTDAQGTVWEKNTENLGERVLSYGFSSPQPVVVSYWKVLLKMDRGDRTEWEVAVDTTFEAVIDSNQTQRLRYMHYGKARFKGWTGVFVPTSPERIQVLDAYWEKVNTLIVNQTTGDTLFATRGIAHQYFDPKLGAIKYTTDFTKSEKGNPTAFLRGTWELLGYELPQ